MATMARVRRRKNQKATRPATHAPGTTMQPTRDGDRVSRSRSEGYTVEACEALLRYYADNKKEGIRCNTAGNNLLRLHPAEGVELIARHGAMTHELAEEVGQILIMRCRGFNAVKHKLSSTTRPGKDLKTDVERRLKKLKQGKSKVSGQGQATGDVLNVKISQDELLYRPKTQETRAVYEQMLAIVCRIMGD